MVVRGGEYVRPLWHTRICRYKHKFRKGDITQKINYANDLTLFLPHDDPPSRSSTASLPPCSSFLNFLLAAFFACVLRRSCVRFCSCLPFISISNNQSLLIFKVFWRQNGPDESVLGLGWESEKHTAYRWVFDEGGPSPLQASNPIMTAQSVHNSLKITIRTREYNFFLHAHTRVYFAFSSKQQI